MTTTKRATHECSGCDRPDPDGNGMCEFCGGLVRKIPQITRLGKRRRSAIVVSVPAEPYQPAPDGSCDRCCAYSDAELATLHKPVRFGSLTLYASGEVKGLGAKLTPRQVTLFRLFMLAKGHVVSYWALQSLVGQPCADSTTRMNIERMRRRLRGSAARIETAVGFGYRLVLDECATGQGADGGSDG